MNPSSLLSAVAMVAVYVFLWIGAPILLLGWLRSRRQEAIQRQIALTDALDHGAVLAHARNPDRAPPGAIVIRDSGFCPLASL
jgi:hypothetical protein